jgi:glycosyltransferase involved in cell wall biosynthesis
VADAEPYDPTAEELLAMRIERLRQDLRDTDYIGSRIAEGSADAERYTNIVTDRAVYRRMLKFYAERASFNRPVQAEDKSAAETIAVSVIVPAYNADATIFRCLDSILVQSLRDFEVIVVDDASTDGTGVLLDALASDCPRISVIHNTDNQGASLARKAGLRRARGEFIYFVDADDFVISDALEKLLAKACSDDLDIVYDWRYYEFQREHFIHRHTHADKIDFLKQIVLHKNCELYKLIRKSLFDDVVFPAESYGEDACILFQCALKTEKIGWVPETLYYHLYNPTSICNNKTNKDKNAAELDVNMKRIWEYAKKAELDADLAPVFTEFANVCMPESVLFDPCVYSDQMVIQHDAVGVYYTNGCCVARNAHIYLSEIEGRDFDYLLSLYNKRCRTCYCRSHQKARFVNSVSIALNGPCNLRCKMCYSVRSKLWTIPSSPDDVRQAFVAALDHFDIILLCSGEIFCWDPHSQMLLSVTEDRKAEKIIVFTNATSLSEEVILTLKAHYAAIKKRLMFIVSIDGTTAGAYKAVRESDAFDTVVTNTKILRDNGMLETAVYTMSEYNQADWINAPRFFHDDLGVSSYAVNFDMYHPEFFVDANGSIVNPRLQFFLDEHFTYYPQFKQNTLKLIKYNGTELLMNTNAPCEEGSGEQ